MNVNLNHERLSAADGNPILYSIIEVLDKYDFGRVGQELPGEYASEARQIIQYFKSEKRPLNDDYLVELMKRQFDLKFQLIFKNKYKQATKEINEIYLRYQSNDIF